MRIKETVVKTYNAGAQYWHKTRQISAVDIATSKPRSENRHHLFIEKPAMFSKIPALGGKSVLCLGCGSGEECKALLTKGPSHIVGIDISTELITIARNKVPAVEFLVMDAEKLNFADETFDFVYSSLMMDYFESWEYLLKEVVRVLKPGGVFLFSNIHPVRWGARVTYAKDGKKSAVSMGFRKARNLQKQIIYGDYLNTKLHKKTWHGKTIYFYSKSVSQMFKELTISGLTVVSIDEPKAIYETKQYDEDYWELNQRIPNFIIFETQKSA